MDVTAVTAQRFENSNGDQLMRIMEAGRARPLYYYRCTKGRIKDHWYVQCFQEYLNRKIQPECCGGYFPFGAPVFFPTQQLALDYMEERALADVR